MRNYLSKIVVFILALIIIFLPFQALLGEMLSYHTNLNAGLIFWLIHWYEPVVLILAPFAFWTLWKSNNGKTTPAIMFALMLVVLGVANIIWLAPSYSYGIEGFRFTLFAVLLFIITALPVRDQTGRKNLLYLYLAAACAISLWGILERFLPVNYWSSWNIIGTDGVFGYGAHKVVAVYQSTSVIGGPNQLAAYLLPAIFVLIIAKKPYLAVIVFLAVVLTFSRSAYLGLAMGAIIYSVLSPYRLQLLGLIAIVILGAWFVWNQAFIGNNRRILDLFTHGSSQDQHQKSLELSVQEVQERWRKPGLFFLGSGLGTAGPLTIKYGKGIISEDWYLQIFFELGAIGLALWLGLITAVSYGLITHRSPINRGLLLGLASVSVAAIFLHTWADNPAMAYTLFILLGYETHTY